MVMREMQKIKTTKVIRRAVTEKKTRIRIKKKMIFFLQTKMMPLIRVDTEIKPIVRVINWKRF